MGDGVLVIDPGFEGWVWREDPSREIGMPLLCPTCAVPAQPSDIPLGKHMSDGMKLFGIVDCENTDCERHTPEIHTLEAMKGMALAAMARMRASE